MNASRTLFVSLSALALLGACGGKSYDDKTTAGLAAAFASTGVELRNDPANQLRSAKEVCTAFDANNGVSAAKPYVGRAGEATMRVSISYVCPEHLTAWDVTVDTLRNL